MAEQDALFDDGAVPEQGFRAPAASQIADISYRQLDYWARTGLVVPTLQDATGSGTQRLYSFGDLVQLRTVKSLLDAGISLQQIRLAIGALRNRGVRDLASVTLMSDGTSVFECTSDNEILDLLRGSHGVFAITMNGIAQDVRGAIAEFPQQTDELAARRASRRAS
jgi:DNA-binding transcriptional MerR regulator